MLARIARGGAALFLLQYCDGYSGWATYYEGLGLGGKCESDYVPEGFVTVAMNKVQYQDGGACGACLKGCIADPTKGEECFLFNAIVDNVCETCDMSDIMVNIPESGSYKVSWSFVDCPAAPINVKVYEGNGYHGKVKVEAGGRVDGLVCNGLEGILTEDGSFVINSPTDSLGCGTSCTIGFRSGTTLTQHIDGSFFGGVCVSPDDGPQVQFIAHSGADVGCAGAWQQCGGDSWFGPTCCAQGGTCIWQSAANSHCLPAHVEPVCSTLQCGGTGYTGATKCCGNNKCVWKSDLYSVCAPTATPGTPDPSADLNCTGAGTQCGGALWVGSKCCSGGAACVYKDYYTSKCQCSGLGYQCGGDGWTGSTCCSAGVCTGLSESKSICMTPPPVSSTCALASWAQCGGKDWTPAVAASAACCKKGSCVLINDWFSQCRTNPLDFSVGVPDYIQCAGTGWDGPHTCANPTSVCTKLSTEYSQCLPVSA